MLAVGLLGTGDTARSHANYFRRCASATVEAVAPAEGPAESFVDQHAPSATPLDTVDALLSAGVDAIDITEPTGRQWELVETALEGDIGVFWGTPTVPEAADLPTFADAVSDRDAVLMLDQPHRFSPDYVAVRRAVDERGVGDISVVHVTRRHSPLAGEGRPSEDDTRISPLLRPAFPDFEYLRSILGGFERVYATADEWSLAESGAEGCANCLLRFESGAIANVELQYERPTTDRSATELEVSGTTGRVSYESESTDSFARYDRESGTRHEADRTHDVVDDQLERFLSCVADGTRPPMTFEKAMAGLRIGIAATASLDRNRPVESSEVTP